MSSIKRVFLTFFSCLILLFSFVFPAFAVIDPEPITFDFAVPDPSTNFDGYIILPTTDGEATLLSWDITPTITSSNGDFTLSSCDVNVHITEHQATVDFYSTVPGQTFVVTVYYISNGSTSYIQRLNTYFIEYGSALGSQVTNRSASFICPNYFKGVTRLTHDNYDLYNPSNSFTYDCVFSDDSSLLNELKDINSHFLHLLSDMDLTNQQFESLLELFQELLDTAVSIDGNLGDFVYYYWEQFSVYDLPKLFSTLSSRLDTIIRLLNKKGEVEQTTVDSSKVDQYADIEQSLVHNDEANSAIGDMNVSIDGQSYAVIWDIITNILNSHPEVFGLVITILTLGFLALILNR